MTYADMLYAVQFNSKQGQAVQSRKGSKWMLISKSFLECLLFSAMVGIAVLNPD
jgi:hypothetical protein